MDSYAIVITILALLCILVVLYLIAKRIKEEHFQAATCNFTYAANTHTSQALCLNECFKTDDCGSSCQTICATAAREDPCLDTNGTTICNINSVTDIYGETQEQCVRKCSANTETCSGCSAFKIFDPITGRDLEGTYTDGAINPSVALDDFKNKCDSSAENHRYCNPCARACYYCSDPNRCRWLPGSDQHGEQIDSRTEFRDHQFHISVIPDDGKATIVWTESNERVKEYKIFIYKKAEVNTNASGQQQTPLTVRTETLTKKNKGTHVSHVIKGLVNGLTYSINVNKVSNHTTPVSMSADSADSGTAATYINTSGPEIISSNTIDIVPSPVTLVNFSRVNRDNTLKQRDLLSVGLLKELTGKTFDISF